MITVWSILHELRNGIGISLGPYATQVGVLLILDAMQCNNDTA